MQDLIFWTPGVTLEALEERVIKQAFAYYHGNKTQTSSSLGISIRTLENKFERYAENEVKRFEAQMQEQRKREEFLARARGQHPVVEVVMNAPVQKTKLKK